MATIALCVIKLGRVFVVADIRALESMYIVEYHSRAEIFLALGYDKVIDDDVLCMAHIETSGRIPVAEHTVLRITIGGRRC